MTTARPIKRRLRRSERREIDRMYWDAEIVGARIQTVPVEELVATKIHAKELAERSDDRITAICAECYGLSPEELEVMEDREFNLLLRRLVEDSKLPKNAEPPSPTPSSSESGTAQK